MKFHVILNQQGGTLRTANMDMLCALLRDEFMLHGHIVDIEVLDSADIEAALEAASRRTDIDGVIAGGGDGTISCAAGALAGTELALGILPAGTMNLYARTLQIPLELSAAIHALAAGTVARVDIASVNGKPFVHQYAVGMHARMVRMREKLNYASKVGKIWASTRAMALTLQKLPMLQLKLNVEGRSETIVTPAVAVSNNLYGTGHLPFSDDPAGGVLGVYICRGTTRKELAQLGLDVWRGRWKDNPSLSVVTTDKIEIVYPGINFHKRAVRDGELEDLASHSTIIIEPKKLKVLVPDEASYLSASPSPAL
ncbi:diacylglycerol kinase [Aureimonas fodinaquatilis]|uniref:Diacylglycerol kinase n=1 Tax=Aureimonas fodinaquatilis TaxID=2565783 RepID=A0A5B0E2Y5_9HYPH|nr:diacylglycerol kinase family protein [Aureimonas fodinaquatilis]KAA0972321.1 diacylglycerol kinase [Aureimonas fodinaquatilis]